MFIQCPFHSLLECVCFVLSRNNSIAQNKIKELIKMIEDILKWCFMYLAKENLHYKKHHTLFVTR